jgi:hypothetical protein
MSVIEGEPLSQPKRFEGLFMTHIVIVIEDWLARTVLVGLQAEGLFTDTP